MAAIYAVFEVFEPAGAPRPETAEPVFVEGEPAARAVLEAVEGAGTGSYGYAVRIALDGRTPLPRCDPDAAVARAALWSPAAPRWVRVPLDPSTGYDAFGEALRDALEPSFADGRAFDIQVSLQFAAGGPVVHAFGLPGLNAYDGLGEAARAELEERLAGPWARWAPLRATIRLQPARTG